MAVSENLEEVVILLLERRAKPDGTDGSGTPALITAIKKDLVHLTHLLLVNKANPNSKDNRGRTAVQLTVQQNKLAHLSALLKHGAKGDVYSLTDTPVLSLALKSDLPSNDLPQYIRLLAESGASPHKTGESSSPRPGAKKTPFALIVAKGQLESIQALLDAGAVASQSIRHEMDSDTILELAVGTGKISIVETLLGAGVGTLEKASMYAHKAAKEDMAIALEDQIRRETRQRRSARGDRAFPVDSQIPPPYKV